MTTTVPRPGLTDLVDSMPTPQPRPDGRLRTHPFIVGQKRLAGGPLRPDPDDPAAVPTVG